MLLNNRNRDLINEAVRHHGLNKRIDGKKGSNSYIKQAEIELLYEYFWNNKIEKRDLKIVDNKTSEMLIEIISYAAEMKGLDETDINRLKRRMKSLDFGLEGLSTDQLLGIYKDLPVVKIISERPQHFYIWKFYCNILSNDKKNKLLHKMFSLPTPQNDIEFVEMTNDNGKIISKEWQIKDRGKKNLILALNDNTERVAKKNQHARYYLKEISSELEEEFENNYFIGYAMSFFVEASTADKIFLYFLHYLNLWSANGIEILKYILELIEEMKSNNKNERAILILDGCTSIFQYMLDELTETNYLPMATIAFKTDLDVESLFEPSVEDLTEGDRKGLERFFETDEMEEYLIYKSDNDFENCNHDFDSDIEENAKYFVLVKHSEVYQRDLILGSLEQRRLKADRAT